MDGLELRVASYSLLGAGFFGFSLERACSVATILIATLTVVVAVRIGAIVVRGITNSTAASAPAIPIGVIAIVICRVAKSVTCLVPARPSIGVTALRVSGIAKTLNDVVITAVVGTCAIALRSIASGE